MNNRWLSDYAFIPLVRDTFTAWQTRLLGRQLRRSTKFVLLTTGGVHAGLLSNFLQSQHYDFEVVVTRPVPPKRRSDQNLIQYRCAAILSKLKSNRYLRAIAGRELPTFAKDYIDGGFLNSRKLIKTLKQLNPTYIVLMNVGIVSPEVIRAAEAGVLNAHPGLLPWIRGVDAVASSLLEGIAPGTTVHLVNDGVDTGPILCRHLLPPGDATELEELKRAANVQALLALIGTIEGIGNGENLNSNVQSLRFPLHRRLRREELNKAIAMASHGRANALYKHWSKQHPELSDGAPLLCKYGWRPDQLTAERTTWREQIKVPIRWLPMVRRNTGSGANA